MLDNQACLILSGFMAIIIGFLIIENHNNWVKNWTVLITIVGWAALVKGVLLLVFPNSFKMYKPLLESNLLTNILTPLVLLFGLVFAYFGFYA